uniref:Nuclear speckle splicing regulatory protein 1 N-terminal domain-containing protein n=1 Tax=Parascaris univalens TaxID=6257 RepID=A0A915ASM8_PARUN
MTTIRRKQFGLILKKNEPSLPVQSTAAAAFANSDDDDAIDTEVMSSANVSASTIRIRMQAKREHERALAQDPSIFDYDAIYDDLQAKKNEKVAEQRAADKERKSKYAEQIIKAHKRRLLEQQSREERKQLKEREAEAGTFDDKEVFVTGAYRKQMEEMQKFRDQEAIENRLDELTAVEKQKGGVWQGGFYRTLLNDLARDGTLASGEGNDSIKKEPPGDEDASSSTKEIPDKLKLLRQQVNKFDDEIIAGPSEVKEKAVRKSSKSESMQKRREESKGKSIYSDESEGDQPQESSDQTVLQPGLNILRKSEKKPTKAEQLHSRFTPSSSDSESTNESVEEARKERERRQRKERKVEGRHRARSHRGQSKSRRRSESDDDRRKRNRDCSRGEKKIKDKKRGDHHERNKREAQTTEQQVDDRNEIEMNVKKIAKPATKQERLKVLKELLKRRNGEKDIAEFRRRYLERKANGTVTLPI